MKTIVLEDSSFKRREISVGENLIKYKLIFKMPIKFLGFRIGHYKIWYEDFCPTIDGVTSDFDLVASYCEGRIKKQRDRSRQRRRNALTVYKKANEYTIRPDKISNQD